MSMFLKMKLKDSSSVTAKDVASLTEPCYAYGRDKSVGELVEFTYNS